MKTIRILWTLLFCILFLGLQAQLDIKGKVKNQSNNKAGGTVEQGIDQGLNGLENGVKGLFKKKKNNTEVMEHNRTAPNNTDKDNWSTKPNVNPETGKKGNKKN